MAKKKKKSYAPEKIGVKEVNTNALIPNPHNPRLLFDREPLDTLKRSIEKVGILVPLTVYRDSKRNQYVILDGQRRWTCAQKIGLQKVPVNQVREPSLVENIVTMFQIHKLREDWELMPTALKLELLMHELQERSDKALSELTGLDQAVVARCKKLLSYPKKYQDMMLDPAPENRVKADFFIELYAIRNDRVVKKMDWYKPDPFTKKMLEKYQSGDKGIRAVTDFRVMKQHINNARKAGKTQQISKRLRKFVESDGALLTELEISSASVTASAQKLTTDVTRLIAQIGDLDVDAYYGEEELWGKLEELVSVIRKAVRKSGRRPNA